MEFHKVTDVKFSELKFSRTKNSSGRRFILAYYNKKNLGLKLPTLKIPFNSKINQFGQLEINVSLGQSEVLIEKIKELDEEMKKFALQHKWYNSEQEYDYTPVLKEAFNGNFPPTLKIKIPVKDDIVKTIFYDENKNIIKVSKQEEVVDLITKGTKIQSAIECVGVWFNDNKFGLAWKAEQIRIMSKPELQEEEYYAFNSDSSDDENSDTELLIDDDE